MTSYSNTIVIPGHAGGQGYEPPPQPPDPIVVTYELYVVDPPLAFKIRGIRAQLWGVSRPEKARRRQKKRTQTRPTRIKASYE